MEVMKTRILQFLNNYLDDLAVIIGILLLSAGGFMIHVSMGLGVLGTGFIVFGVLAGKAGAAIDSKKRNKQG
jgi:multisubunit Na+/H+ antiporter MnhC subunit